MFPVKLKKMENLPENSCIGIDSKFDLDTNFIS